MRETIAARAAREATQKKADQQRVKKAATQRQDVDPETNEPIPPPQPKPLKVGKEPVAIYDFSRSGFWMKQPNGEYVPYSEAQLRRVLKYRHYSDITDKEQNYCLCDKHLMHLQEESAVAYAGPLAGFRPGIHEVSHTRVLVTKGPKLIVPVAGDWPLLKKLTEELFCSNLHQVYAWLKVSLRVLYAGVHPFRPAPMLAIAGPRGCGKSLFQNLITEIFGGRCAHPYKYLIGLTNFNSNLFSAEHLMIEDNSPKTDLRYRKEFGENLKNLVFNQTQTYSKKHRDDYTVSVFARVTITLNDAPEQLAMMPPMDDSLLDKITLLAAHPATFPYGDDDLQGRQTYWRSLIAELPAFLHFLRRWRIPKALTGQRSGVKAYQDPMLLKKILLLAPETALLEWIDHLQIWDIDRNIWIGSSTMLQGALEEKDKSGRVAKLLGWWGACGTYLTRLVANFPDRFAKRRRHEVNQEFMIAPPGKILTVEQKQEFQKEVAGENLAMGG